MDDETQLEGPQLEVGQIWSLGGRQIAITRLGKHLAEYRDCRDGKVITRGRADLKTVRQIKRELLKNKAKLAGRVPGQRRFL